MFSEDEYLMLKGLKKRSPEEETRWQSVREERRHIQKAEAMKSMRAAFSDEKKDAERARVREQRAKLTKNEATAANKRATNLRQIARAKTAEGEASETVVESVVETVVVVVPYTGEPTSLNNDEVAAILGREGMDEDMGRQDSTNSVVEEIIVNTVSGSHLPELGEHFWINLCFLK